MADTTESSTHQGTLYGVGVGPGDPELLTLKAARLIRECRMLTYIADSEGYSMARSIAAGFIEPASMAEYPIVMPMCSNRDIANGVYDTAATAIAEQLRAGNDVVFLCAGDPFFFGSFAYMHDRLNDCFAVQVVPGVSSVHACSALSGRALALQAENVAVISGRRSDADILSALRHFDNVAIMKAGRHRRRLTELIQHSGRTKQGCYIEHAGGEDERVVLDLDQLDNQPGPYFSMFLVNRPRCYDGAGTEETT